MQIKCPNCGFDISDSDQEDSLAEQYLNSPPEGAWLLEDSNKFIAGVLIQDKTQAIGNALVGFFFAAFFGYILLMCYTSKTLNISAIIVCGVFYIVPIYCLGTVLKSVYGKIELQCVDGNVTIFSGVSKFGKKRSFPLNTIQVIKKKSEYDFENSLFHKIVIQIKDRNEVELGYGYDLKTNKKEFLYYALRKMQQRNIGLSNHPAQEDRQGTRAFERGREIEQ